MLQTKQLLQYSNTIGTITLYDNLPKSKIKIGVKYWGDTKEIPYIIEYEGKNKNNYFITKIITAFNSPNFKIKNGRVF